MTREYAGTTALITGASSGLGEEFARQLARRGADLILVARRADRLESLAGELRTTTGRTITVIPSDLAQAGAGQTLAEAVAAKGLSVDTLVNNAGFATRGRFEDEDPARIQEEIALNVAALVGITRTFYPAMLASGRGALVNIASTAAYQPVPLMAVYGATKAFVLSFTEALWSEARHSDLNVLALSPGATRTEFFDIAGEAAQVGTMQTASEVVALALATLDRPRPAPSVISGRANKLTAFASRILPRRAVAKISGTVTGRK